MRANFMELVVQLKVFLKLHKLHIADVERLGNLLNKGKNEFKRVIECLGGLPPRKILEICEYYGAFLCNIVNFNNNFAC